MGMLLKIHSYRVVFRLVVSLVAFRGGYRHVFGVHFCVGQGAYVHYHIVVAGIGG